MCRGILVAFASACCGSNASGTISNIRFARDDAAIVDGAWDINGNHDQPGHVAPEEKETLYAGHKESRRPVVDCGSARDESGYSVSWYGCETGACFRNISLIKDRESTKEEVVHGTQCTGTCRNYSQCTTSTLALAPANKHDSNGSGPLLPLLRAEGSRRQFGLEHTSNAKQRFAESAQ